MKKGITPAKVSVRMSAEGFSFMTARACIAWSKSVPHPSSVAIFFASETVGGTMGKSSGVDRVWTWWLGQGLRLWHYGSDVAVGVSMLGHQGSATLNPGLPQNLPWYALPRYA